MTYRMIAILTIALVFAPVLNYSVADVINQDNTTQQQSDTPSSSKCHKKSTHNKCKHCSASLGKHSCNHGNGACGNNCSSHYVVTIAITTSTIDSPHFQQIFLNSPEKITLSIDLDSELRPPQFA